jgi:8-amino-3,8-dideoxy-alpha-D-manno-octulosonate transaminase
VPGFEVFGREEQDAINGLFNSNGGILFAHGFDAMRNGIYKVREYEKAFSEKLDFKYGQAVSSGTAALRVALEAAGVKAGDEVITQSHTFIATVEAIMSIGAIPVVVDIDETLNMNPKSFEAAIGRKTRAVMPVHMLGEMANMVEISHIARKHGILIIEDCAQGLGASIGEKRAGSFSCVAAFSTDAGKTLNTGEGGMVLTNDQSTYLQARSLHDHGHAYEEGTPRGLDPAVSLGFNFRMTELQGAIGLAQLKKFDDIVRIQRANRQSLINSLISVACDYRQLIDPYGGAGDTLVMLAGSQEQATKVVSRMKEKGLGTKNLPDAMKWHFAGFWGHLSGRSKKFDKALKGGWSQSAEILNRSIAVGISLKWTASDIERISEGIISAWE